MAEGKRIEEVWSNKVSSGMNGFRIKNIPINYLGMKKNKLSICLLIFLTTGLHSKISCAQTITLSQILDSIDIRNPALQQYELKTKSSYAMGNAARSWMAPSAGIGLSEFPYGDYSKMDNEMMPRKMVMLHLEQMFPDFSKQKNEQDYYQSFAQQNKDDRLTEENILFSKAKKAFYNALIAEKKLGVLKEQESQLQLLIKITEGRLQYNKASLPAIYKAKASLSDFDLQRLNLKSIISQEIIQLNTLMNNPPDLPITLDTSLNFEYEEINILPIDSLYIQNHRSDIVRFSDEIHTMKLEQKTTAQSSKPSFGISWDNMRMNNGMYMYDAMAMVSIPIVPWFSKGYKSKINAMDYQIQALQKMKEEQTISALGN
ncbi:MAG: TolC family protein, partial [Chitinophagaceae bacterium]